MRKLLREYIQLLSESEASEYFEMLVASSINRFKRKGISAIRAGGNTALPDVAVSIGDITSYVEAKMNHTDNLANPRVFFDGEKWDTTYETPAAKFTVRLMNSSQGVNSWMQELAEFAGMSNFLGMKIPTTKGGMKDPNAVPYNIMKNFVKSGRGGYITKEPAPVAKIVTSHYTIGKAAPANYMQAGDDFYLIGGKDPFGLKKVAPGIPQLRGSGELKVRVAIRSSEPWYEVQAELKLENLPESPYSVLSTSSKENPFELLAKKR